MNQRALSLALLPLALASTSLVGRGDNLEQALPMPHLPQHADDVRAVFNRDSLSATREQVNRPAVLPSPVKGV